MKRTIALLLALVMLLAMTACTITEIPASESPATSAPTVEAVETAAPSPEPSQPEVSQAPPVEQTPELPPEETPDLTIQLPISETTLTYTLWTGVSPDLSQIISTVNDFSVFQEMERRTNIRLTGNAISAFAETEQFNLMMVSQEYSDIINGIVNGFGGGYTGGADAAIEDDVIIDLWPLVQEYCPNYMAALNMDDSIRPQVMTDSGKMGMFYSFFTEEKPADAGALMRQDWLDDLGFAAPQTYDELYEALTAFKVEKGADAALIIPSSAVPGNSNLIGGYGVSNGWYQVDGEVRFGITQPEFKEYIQMISKWYSEGLIWDDFVNLDGDRLVDFTTILGDRTGMWFGGVQDMQNVNDQAADPSFRCYAVADQTKKAGETTHLGTLGSYVNSGTWAISTVCENVEPLLKYIDYMYSDEGTILCNYGIEGEAHEIGADGKPYLTDLVLNNADGLPYRVTVAMYCFDKMNSVPFKLDNSKSYASYTDDQMDALDIWGSNTDGAYNMPTGYSLTVEETEEYTRAYADIETYIDENVLAYVLGEKSFDLWDSFVAQIKEMNIDACRGIQQAAYDRYMNKIA